MANGVIIYIDPETRGEWDRFLEIENKNNTHVLLMDETNEMLPRATILGIPRYGAENIRNSLRHIIRK